MRYIRCSILLLATALAAGCVPDKTVSLYPLYDDQTLILEPAIEGVWTAGDHETWTFKKAENKQYQLVIKMLADKSQQEKPDFDTIELDAHLVQLASALFLDLYSKDAGPTGAPAHLFAKIRIDRDSLHIGWLDEDWMRTQLDQESYMSHVRTPDDRVVLTASTRDLQVFFSRHAWEIAESENGPDQPQEELHRVHTGL